MSRPFRLLARCVAGDPEAPTALFRVIQRLRVPIEGIDPDEVRQTVAIKVLTDAPALFSRLLHQEPELADRAPDAEAVLALPDDARSRADRRFSGYLRKMARNAAIDLRRQARRHPAPSDPDLSTHPDPHADPSADAAARELGDALREVLESLPETLRTLLDDMVALRLRELTIDDLVDRELKAIEPPLPERTRVRERIYKRHRDARNRLDRQVRQRVARGVLDPGHGNDLIDLIASLRRRIPRSGSVPPAGRSS